MQRYVNQTELSVHPTRRDGNHSHWCGLIQASTGSSRPRHPRQHAGRIYYGARDLLVLGLLHYLYQRALCGQWLRRRGKLAICDFSRSTRQYHDPCNATWSVPRRQEGLSGSSKLRIWPSSDHWRRRNTLAKINVYFRTDACSPT